jgi:hypothetical protein
MQPKRGETRFTVQGTPPVLTTSASAKSGCGGLGCLVVLVLFLGVCSQLVHESGPAPSPSSMSASSSYISTPAGPPVAPTPQFARFSVSGSRPEAVLPSEVTFSNERIQVIRVASIREIPAEVRQRATIVRGGGRQVVPLKSSSHAFVLIGNVNITMGRLEGRDAWSASVLANNGGVDRLDAKFRPQDPDVPSDLRFPPQLGALDSSRVPVDLSPATLAQLRTSLLTARPPPPEPRQVYVVGKIETINGPAQTDNSTAAYRILDLRVQDDEISKYRQDYATYLAEKQMEGLRDRYPGVRSTDRPYEHSYEHPYEHPMEAPHPMAVP